MGKFFTVPEDAEVIRLKERVGGSWKALEALFRTTFPGSTRKHNDLQVRYTRSLRVGKLHRAAALAYNPPASPTTSGPLPAPGLATKKPTRKTRSVQADSKRAASLRPSVPGPVETTTTRKTRSAGPIAVTDAASDFSSISNPMPAKAVPNILSRGEIKRTARKSQSTQLNTTAPAIGHNASAIPVELDDPEEFIMSGALQGDDPASTPSPQLTTQSGPKAQNYVTRIPPAPKQVSKKSDAPAQPPKEKKMDFGHAEPKKHSWDVHELWGDKWWAELGRSNTVRIASKGRLKG